MKKLLSFLWVVLALSITHASAQDVIGSIDKFCWETIQNDSGELELVITVDNVTIADVVKYRIWTSTDPVDTARVLFKELPMGECFIRETIDNSVSYNITVNVFGLDSGLATRVRR